MRLPDHLYRAVRQLQRYLLSRSATVSNTSHGQLGRRTAYCDVPAAREGLDRLVRVQHNDDLGDICAESAWSAMNDSLVQYRKLTRSNLQSPSDTGRGDTAGSRPAPVRQTSNDEP